MADKPANGGSTEAPAKSRHRSPNYPSIGLRAAVSKIQSVYKAAGLAPLMKLTALKQMGLSKDDANAARELAALKSFGLIEELENDRLKLTQRGVDIVARQEGEPQRSAALRVAASGPQIYRALLTEYADTGVPPDAALKSELIAVKRFNPNVVGDFIKDFRDTLDFAGLSDLSVVELPKEEVEGGGNGVKGKVYTPKIGEYVQWEHNGILGLSEPKKIIKFTPDGTYAHLEGQHGAVPTNELIRADTPPGAPPEVNLGQRQSPPKTNIMREFVVPLSDGSKAVFQWPTSLSKEDIEDLRDSLKIVERKITRSIADTKEQASAEESTKES